jgi:pilus assembly protein CpaF
MADFRQLVHNNWKLRRDPLKSRTAAVESALKSGSSRLEPARRAPVLPPRQLRQEIFARLLREVESQGLESWKDPAEVRARVRGILDREVGRGDPPILSASERAYIEDQVVAEVNGLGPLEALLKDPTVSDVLVNGPENIWVDRFGRLERSKARFDDAAHLMRLLGRLVAAHGRHLDEASPLVDVRLSDGSRLHALIPPLCKHPVVSIRRMRVVPFQIEELIASGTLTSDMAEVLESAVAGRLNIAVSGGAASGKTTLLNLLSRAIPQGERVVTIEETAELRLEHPHVVSVEARLPNIEGRGEVTLRSLVKTALRMRADRIIVGEVRGAEVFDMLQAMNTGHEGSLTTVHANSPKDALRRLENLVLIAGLDLPSAAIREFLGAAFDLIVHVNRFHDGSRRITSICEVGFEGGQLSTRELFRYEAPSAVAGAQGRFSATGARPTFLPKLLAAGVPVPGIFRQSATPTPSPQQKAAAGGETLPKADQKPPIVREYPE